MRRRVVLSSLVAAVVLVGLMAQPGGAVNVPQPVVVSADPANWTPHVLDGKVDAIVVVGGKVVAGGLFTRVATADDPATPIPRSNIFAFDATTGALSPDLNLQFSGPRTGTLNVDKFDITPDGSS